MNESSLQVVAAALERHWLDSATDKELELLTRVRFSWCCDFFPALTGERCEQSVTISLRAGLATLLAGVSAGVSGVSAAHVCDHVTCSAGRRRPDR